MSTESLRASEELSARTSTHPRVSIAAIEGAIASRYFTTADKACNEPDYPQLRLMTLCFLVMRNGYVVVGSSTPASPENFDAEKGKTFAYENAVRQLWPLMGYALRDMLNDNKTPG